MNDGFLEAMKAAAISSKFYGMYVLYKMLGKGNLDDDPYDGDDPVKKGNWQAKQAELLEAQGALKADIKQEALANGGIALQPNPVGIAGNPFITAVYSPKKCPNTGDGGCQGLIFFSVANPALDFAMRASGPAWVNSPGEFSRRRRRPNAEISPGVPACAKPPQNASSSHRAGNPANLRNSLRPERKKTTSFLRVCNTKVHSPVRY